MRIDTKKIGRKALVSVHDLVALNAWVCLCVFAVSFIDDPNWRLDYQSLGMLASVGYLVGLHFTPIIMDRTSLRPGAILGRCLSIGITGWAQVNGLRGETRELRDMERRVRHDIWYVEHWSFWLDLRIIVKTVTNMLVGDKGNAY